MCRNMNKSGNINDSVKPARQYNIMFYHKYQYLRSNCSKIHFKNKINKTLPRIPTFCIIYFKY